MRLIFWASVFFWWGMEIYVLVLKRKNYEELADKKTKYIMSALILTGVLLAVINPSFRAQWRTVEQFSKVQILGIFLVLAGVTIRFIAILTLGKFFTPDLGRVEGHKIVDKGIYKFIRHPSYTGEIIAFGGLAFLFSHIPSSLFIFFLPTTAFVYRAIVEERKMIELFGEEYINYIKRTRMFI